MDIILASTSVYRKRLLQRLGLAFHCQPPDIDESRLHQETPEAMASRLALAKARAIAERHPGSLVIGSDQVASLDGAVMGKPGDHTAAAAQLRASSGREVQFYTGLALLCTERQLQLTHLEKFSVGFRSLTEQQINEYLQREQPFDCAGSFKAEGLGIALFTALKGNDPSSLEGLPLIALVSLLAQAGVPVLGGDCDTVAEPEK